MSIFWQGIRSYAVGDSKVDLNSEQIRKIKSMKKMSAFDSNFVTTLATVVFGEEVLKMSSAGGRRSNYNKASHIPLDAAKLKFIEGEESHNGKEFIDTLSFVSSFQIFFLNGCVSMVLERNISRSSSTRSAIIYDADKFTIVRDVGD